MRLCPGIGGMKVCPGFVSVGEKRPSFQAQPDLGGLPVALDGGSREKTQLSRQLVAIGSL